MTLTELSYQYNFHDCDVFLPFDVCGDAITVTFDLAKHMQYDDRFDRKHMMENTTDHLIVKLRFLHCADIQAVEWSYAENKKIAKLKKVNEKVTSVEAFNQDLFLNSVAFIGEDRLSFMFEGDPNLGGEICFSPLDIEIIEERLVDEKAFDEMCEALE
ncbi:MAG: hypothetical protein E7664_05650 [Ruminococcaceae bacterium]|nr:hypothetical protein [Oscillospiraceae bacterium]